MDKGETKERYKDWTTWEIGSPLYWKASDEVVSIIKQEWEKAKEIVKQGVYVENVKFGSSFRQENNLLKSSNTKVIHIRPHANDSKDIDVPYYEYSKKKVGISWQSFWLNKSFIESIINPVFLGDHNLFKE